MGPEALSIPRALPACTIGQDSLHPFRCEALQQCRMGNKDSDPSASVLDLGEDDLPGFSTAFDTVASGASEGDSDSGSEAGHAEQLLYWEVSGCLHRHFDAMDHISLVLSNNAPCQCHMVSWVVKCHVQLHLLTAL